MMWSTYLTAGRPVHIRQQIQINSPCTGGPRRSWTRFAGMLAMTMTRRRWGSSLCKCYALERSV